MNTRSLIISGLVAGMGLTVALFVAGVAFQDPTLQGAAKMGALLSSVAAPLALIAGKLFRVERVDADDVVDERDEVRSVIGAAEAHDPGPT